MQNDCVQNDPTKKCFLDRCNNSDPHQTNKSAAGMSTQSLFSLTTAKMLWDLFMHLFFL